MDLGCSRLAMVADGDGLAADGSSLGLPPLKRSAERATTFSVSPFPVSSLPQAPIEGVKKVMSPEFPEPPWAVAGAGLTARD